MRRVLVTGAHGFLGRHTVRELRSRGWEAVPAARSTGDGSAIIVDLADPLFLHKLKAIEPCAAIVHLASEVDWSPRPRQAMYRTNVHATSALATLAQDWGAHVVFSSAAMVCGARTPFIGPDSAVAPDTPYGQTKWLAEQLLSTALIAAANLRFGGIFGADGPAHLGLNRAIAGALAGEAPTLAGAGTARRNYIYVEDAARAIAFALEQGVCGTHLIAGAETLSISQWLAHVCRALLPSAQVRSTPGAEAGDQIIEPSAVFPPTRSVAEAMADLRVTKP